MTDPRSIALWAGVLAAVTPAVSALHQLLAARFIQGLFAGFTPMAMALASVSAPADRVPAVIAMLRSAQLMSNAVGPAAGGYVASHFGIRYAFFVTAGMCALALIALIVLFREIRQGGAGRPGADAPRLRMRDVLRHRNFPTVVALLLLSQFLDRGLALLIPLHVTQLPGVDAIAAVSGTIISVAAVAATVSSLPGAYVFDGVLAWAAAALLAFGARGLRTRRDRADPT